MWTLQNNKKKSHARVILVLFCFYLVKSLLFNVNSVKDCQISMKRMDEVSMQFSLFKKGLHVRLKQRVFFFNFQALRDYQQLYYLEFNAFRNEVLRFRWNLAIYNFDATKGVA